MVSKEYLAGLFDGEGCILIGLRNKVKRFITMYVTITNQNEEVLYAVKAIYGGIIIYPKGKNPCSRWQVPCNKALKFLEDVYPYLIIKKEEAKIAIDYQKWKNKLNLCRFRPKTKAIIEKEDWYRNILKEVRRNKREFAYRNYKDGGVKKDG